MKRLVIILFVLFTAFQILAQPHRGRFQGRERIEQLEKIKLLEILDLSEDASVRFISRLDSHRDKQHELRKERDELIKNAEEIFTVDGSKDKIADLSVQIMKIERDMFNNRDQFLESLSDLMTKEQILKYIIFEIRFREEIRDVLLERRGPPFRRDGEK